MELSTYLPSALSRGDNLAPSPAWQAPDEAFGPEEDLLRALGGLSISQRARPPRLYLGLPGESPPGEGLEGDPEEDPEGSSGNDSGESDASDMEEDRGLVAPAPKEPAPLDFGRFPDLDPQEAANLAAVFAEAAGALEPAPGFCGAGAEEMSLDLDHEVFREDWLPPEVHVYPPVALPKTMLVILADPALVAKLCQYCCNFQNLRTEGGRVVEALCGSCRQAVSRHPPNACSKRGPRCETYCFVDEVGFLAPQCRGCHAAPAPRSRQGGGRQGGGRQGGGRQGGRGQKGQGGRHQGGQRRGFGH